MDKYCPGSPKWAFVRPAIGANRTDLVVPVGFVPEMTEVGAIYEAEWNEFQRKIDITVCKI